MITPPKQATTDIPMSSNFTVEGLPLDRSQFGAAAKTIDAGDGGTARRVDCRPPQLTSAPTIRPSRRPPSKARRASSLRQDSIRRSLIDDEDEAIDYFDKSSAPNTILATAKYLAPQPTDSRWDVRKHNVPTLPSFYPLEKFAVFIPQASAPILAGRIAAVLQDRSIAASYDAENAKVDCVSKSQVEFRIRLYRGRGEYTHGIVVEIQRRLGFDLSYTQDVYAILDAAEGKNMKDHQGGYYKEAGSVICGDEEDINSLKNTGGLASLSVVSDILCPKDGVVVIVEGRDFALSSLAALTSLNRMGQVAVQFSKELLVSDRLLRAVLSYVGPDPKNQIPLRPMLLSLEILANATTAFTQNHLSTAELPFQRDHEIFLKLISNVESASHNPRAADLSCLILKNIFQSQVVEILEAVPTHYKERLSIAMIQAVSYGGECYAELKEHAQQCLQLMQI